MKLVALCLVSGVVAPLPQIVDITGDVIGQIVTGDVIGQAEADTLYLADPRSLLQTGNALCTVADLDYCEQRGYEQNLALQNDYPVDQTIVGCEAWDQLQCTGIMPDVTWPWVVCAAQLRNRCPAWHCVTASASVYLAYTSMGGRVADPLVFIVDFADTLFMSAGGSKLFFTLKMRHLDGAVQKFLPELDARSRNWLVLFAGAIFLGLCRVVPTRLAECMKWGLMHIKGKYGYIQIWLRPTTATRTTPSRPSLATSASTPHHSPRHLSRDTHR